MPHLAFAQLVNRAVPLTAAEAAALTLGVARVLDVRRRAGMPVQVPEDEWILLSSTGEVSIVDVQGTAVADETAALSALLRRLLRLDDRSPSDAAGVPGGLLIVLARNLGYIHLPATSPLAFRAALERFATPDRSALAAVFWRAAANRSDVASPMPALVSPAPRACVDRRRRGLSSAELRRALRDVEREFFELQCAVLRRSSIAGMAFPHGRTAVASVGAVLLIGILALAGLVLTGTGSDAQGASEVAVVPGDAPPIEAQILPVVGKAGPASVSSVSPNDARLADTRPPARRRARRPSPPASKAVTSEPRQFRAASEAASPTPEPPDGERTRPATPRRPLAAMPGGTRGIPFALPAS